MAWAASSQQATFRRWIAPLGLAFGLAPTPAAARAHDPVAEEQATAALYRCFEQGLAENDNDLPPIAPTPATELFFWHQLGEAHRELGGLAQLGWCKPYFVDPIRQAQQKLLQSSPKRAPVVSAPRAFTKLQGVAITPPAVTSHHIVQAAEAHGASRHRGTVGAVTRAALAAPQVAHWQLVGLEQDYVVAAAESLDTLLYHATQWHAESEAGAVRPTPHEVVVSRQRYVAHLTSVAALSRAKVADEGALLAVGLVAGLVVDLFVHRGLSPAEWTALHVAHAPFGQAQQGGVDRDAALAAVLRVWQAMLGAQSPQGTVPPATARALGDGKPEEAVMLSLGRLAPEARPLQAGELWQQVRHASAFKSLQQGTAPPADAAYWSVDDTLDAVVHALTSSSAAAGGVPAPQR